MPVLRFILKRDDNCRQFYDLCHWYLHPECARVRVQEQPIIVLSPDQAQGIF